MVLVGYSESEGSDTESTPIPTQKPGSIQSSKPTPTAQNTNFAVDKTNPKKIRVNLAESLKQLTSTTDDDGEPAAKRPRVGAGAFSGFNAMLPAPKRDNMSNNVGSTNGTGNKTAARKVFSLKTGAEPAFSRDSDAELRDLFSDGGKGTEQSTIPASIPKPAFITENKDATSTASGGGGGSASGKPFMFKPLSVARNTKKKKSTGTTGAPSSSTPVAASSIQHSCTPLRPPDQQEQNTAPAPTQKKEKISLFSSGPTELPPDVENTRLGTNTDTDDLADEEDEIVELLDDDSTPSFQQPSTSTPNQTESLDSIADTLNLSAAERRQLLGRSSSKNTSSASRVINFNTDAEYIANQAANAAGESVQHNPVRSIAPGKHSLKSLVASAQGQKDALEESFMSGRKNKREAGSKYGW